MNVAALKPCRVFLIWEQICLDPSYVQILIWTNYSSVQRWTEVASVCNSPAFGWSRTFIHTFSNRVLCLFSCTQLGLILHGRCDAFHFYTKMLCFLKSELISNFVKVTHYKVFQFQRQCDCTTLSGLMEFTFVIFCSKILSFHLIKVQF